MLKNTVLIFFIFFSSVSVTNAEYPKWWTKNGWVEFGEFCNVIYKGQGVDCSDGLLITENSSFSHWAGEVIEVYFDTSTKNYTNFKVKITWTTDRSPYACGSIIKVRPSDVKDFTHRSLKMKRCN